jgi:glycosyltransferase involved in cell wall biosynthesis
MDENLMPLVSVLLPVYNAESYVAEAIESILNQTYKNFEFIIVNDDSSDRSEEVIFSFSDERIRYYRNEANLGLIGTLNKSIGLSSGKYLARMDNDDICLPERLAKQVAFLEAHSEVGVLGTAFYNIDKAGEISSETAFPSQHILLCWSLCFFSPLAHPTVMMRRELVQREGGYKDGIVHCEDYDFWYRLSNKTKLSNLQDVLFKLRKHEMNSSSLFDTTQFNNSIIVSRKMISHLIKEDISEDLVRNLWTKDIKSIDEAKRIAALIKKIYIAINTDNTLSPNETKYLRRDFALRISNIMWPWRGHLVAWRYIGMSFYYDPMFLPSTIKAFVKKG